MTAASIWVSAATGVLAAAAACTAGLAIWRSRRARKEAESELNALKLAQEAELRLAEYSVARKSGEAIPPPRRRAPDRIGYAVRRFVQSFLGERRTVGDGGLRTRGGRHTVRHAVAARRLADVASFLLPAADRTRYSEEFLGELWDLAVSGEGRLRQLLHALRQLCSILPLRFALRFPRRRNAAP